MSDTSHLVLARKYRPNVFSELIGQEQLVRVLRNSFKMNKVAHGYILTGVRGVGKTTTARIIAKTLNCEKNKNKAAGTPIEDPCGQCDQCIAIAEYRHVDVQEMDAASNNRVDDVRAIIDSVGYRPVLGQYRVYILDEAHMITTQAFNALLKTLEEPPPHLIFILATTEVQKIPATILSRCIRFDLRRVPTEQLASHFQSILQKEKVTMSDSAVTLIARAAEGSVRDGLSMLDQAIALNPEGVGEDDVLAMLGLSDITKIYHLLQHIMAGDAPAAMTQYNDLISLGAAPDMVMEQLMEAVHTMTKMGLDEDYHRTSALSETEKNLSSDLYKKLSLPILTRAWQMLLKGMTELRTAPDAITAGEMLLIRLMMVSNTPTPGELASIVREELDKPSINAPVNAPTNAPLNAPTNSGVNTKNNEGQVRQSQMKNAGDPAAQYSDKDDSQNSEANLAEDSGDDVENTGEPTPQATKPSHKVQPPLLSFADLTAVVAQKDMMLSTDMRTGIRLIQCDFPTDEHGGLLVFQKIDEGSEKLANRLREQLSKITDSLWKVTLSDEPGQPTLDEALYEKIASNKTFKLAMELFPNSKILNPKIIIKKGNKSS